MISVVFDPASGMSDYGISQYEQYLISALWSGGESKLLFQCEVVVLLSVVMDFEKI